MSYNWKDYYDLAKKLGVDAQADGENLSDAMLRSSISRAYYSVYNVALEHAGSLGYIFSKDRNRGHHEDLIKFFGDRTDQDSKKIAMRLETCRDFRTVTDYHTEISDDYHELDRMKDQTITRVEDVFQIIEN